MRKFLDPSEISSGFSRFAFAVAGYPGTFGLRPRARECHARTPVLYRLTVFSRFRRKSNAAVVVEGKLVVIFAREFGDLVQTSEDTSWLAVERGYADTAPRVLVEDPSLWTHEEVSHEPAGQTHRRRPLVGDGDERRVPAASVHGHEQQPGRVDATEVDVTSALPKADDGSERPAQK